MSSTASPSPKIVILFCGKRKSGKDHVVSLLQSELQSKGLVCDVLRLSEPLKSAYAKEHGLEVHRLLDSTPYKEQFRYDMIRWGEERREADAGYFCRLCVAAAVTHHAAAVWLVSDARRPIDMEYFTSRFRCASVRVCASEQTRRGRGWEFREGVDDADSECALDGYTTDRTVQNDGDSEQLKRDLSAIVELVANVPQP